MAIIRTSKTIVIILTVAALALIASTFAAITVNTNVPSSGTIATTPNIAVFSDSACNTPITSVTWGNLSPGGSTQQTVYVKNTGTATMTLSMFVSNWNPSNAGTYLTITWNREGSNLLAGTSTSATLTLIVSPGITGISSFSNTITFSGTG